MADRLPLDFDPPVRRIRALLLGVGDGDLAAPTPCPDWSVGGLLDHLMGLAIAFTWHQGRKPGPLGPGGSPVRPGGVSS